MTLTYEMTITLLDKVTSPEMDLLHTLDSVSENLYGWQEYLSETLSTVDDIAGNVDDLLNVIGDGTYGEVDESLVDGIMSIATALRSIDQWGYMRKAIEKYPEEVSRPFDEAMDVIERMLP